MFKKIFACLLITLVSVFSFTGCGELSFKQTPYGKSDKKDSEIVVFYNAAHAGNKQLKAKYVVNSTLVTGNTTIKTKYQYILGNIGDKAYCKIVEDVYENDVYKSMIETIYYQTTTDTGTPKNGIKGVTSIDIATGTTIKTKCAVETTNIIRDTVNFLFPTLYAESFEKTGHKEYNKQHYYKIILTKESVNEDYIEPEIAVPENTYCTLYSYAFGVNRKGYISYFTLDYELQDNSREVVSTYTSLIELKEYGDEMYIGEPPVFDDYTEVTE